MREGRTPSQLCLSNPEVLELVTRSFVRAFEEHPDVRYISFSQEDNYDACACEACAAIDKREGTQMGSLLTFVNSLAERFPERTISTLAYQYSRRPPRTLRPRANVSIMLCTIEEDRARPIATNPESDFPADLTGWSTITNDIFLWDYEVQFASPVAPFPNLRTLSRPAPTGTWAPALPPGSSSMSCASSSGLPCKWEIITGLGILGPRPGVAARPR